jgi:amino acid transporter
VLGTGALLAYGIGDILGAGIYALVGEVARVAGDSAWLSFAGATGVAALTGLSYAELGARFPHSAGEAHFARIAFGREGLALFAGWLVFAASMVSIATVSWGFAGYASGFLPWLPERAAVAAFLLLLAGVTLRGMREASLANILCTAAELSGLLLVLGAGAAFLARGGPPAPAAAAPPGAVGLLQGGALAFYAFIGFEDLVKAAEEVRRPERALPLAILLAIAAAGLLYVGVSWVALEVLGADALAASSAPLLDVMRRAAPGVPGGLFLLLALLAVANTALVNFVMMTRLLYGMARQGLLPAWLGRVHPRRRTPHLAALALLAVAAALALTGSLARLAGTTSVLVLAVFFGVNLALLAIRRQRGAPAGFRVPLWVPLLGAAGSLALLVYVPPRALVQGLAIAGVGLAAIAWRGRRAPPTAAAA